MEVEMQLPGTASLVAFCAEDEFERQFTDEVKNILEVIAWTGKYWHDWALLKCLLSFRLKQVLTQYYDAHLAAGGQKTLVSGEAFNDYLTRLLECLDSFIDGPPFTVQRLCELLLNPRLAYPNVDKASLAFEKLLLVTSSIPICTDPYPTKGQQSWNKMQETGLVANMMIENGTSESSYDSEQEMRDVPINEDKQSGSASQKLPKEEASLSIEKRTKDADKSLGSLSNSEKPQGLLDSPLLDDDLVDIALDDQNLVTEEA